MRISSCPAGRARAQDAPRHADGDDLPRAWPGAAPAPGRSRRLSARTDRDRGSHRRRCRPVIAECPQDDVGSAATSTTRRRIGSPPFRAASTSPSSLPGDRLAARRALGFGEHEFIVLQLGRMVPRKGVDNVIRAVSMLAASSCRDSSSSAAMSAAEDAGACAEEQPPGRARRQQRHRRAGDVRRPPWPRRTGALLHGMPTSS